jgi:transcriptional regulator GlxA family with amidase domain
MKTRCVGLFVYDGAVLIEFAGPLQVFDVANRVHAKAAADAPPPFEYRLISKTGKPITTREGVTIEVHNAFGNHPSLDVVLVPGGALSAELQDPAVLDWLSAVSAQAEATTSVCVGSFLLGRASLLDGRSATTHFDDADALAALAPDTKVAIDKLWVEDGRIVTAGGYAAGIDMALHLVERFGGKELSVEAARQLEYPLRRDNRRLH